MLADEQWWATMFTPLQLTTGEWLKHPAQAAAVEQPVQVFRPMVAKNRCELELLRTNCLFHVDDPVDHRHLPLSPASTTGALLNQQ
jgi:hypothetical protein